ncbi:acyl-CoA dehydrogenase family protein [Streptomyces sp. NBC_01762]|nr:acyl-CoA dehydrogenase family protein [Streptomyces sp. NBC_01762]
MLRTVAPLAPRTRPGADPAGVDLTAEDVAPALWRLSAELGRLGLELPEEHGGTGQGLVELALFAREINRAAACGVLEQQPDIAVEHAKARVHFGRSMGTIQAATHKRTTIAMHVPTPSGPPPPAPRWPPTRDPPTTCPCWTAPARGRD